MRLIISHTNADLDALASMVAAQKLYPDAMLCFPGSQTKNLRELTTETLLYQYEFQRAKDIPLEEIDTLIIVDTRSSEKIGVFKKCLENPTVEIHLYDHHPETPGDISGNQEYIEDFGATTTILVQRLKEKNISLTPDEATILCLGIYEDTGSLSHQTTTPEDLEAAAWLVRSGAQLDIVSQFITHELTTMQVELIHELVNNTERYNIQGLPITVVAMSFPEYIDDFSLIVHRFMNMENLDTLFATIRMANRTYLIARSRIPDVNVGAIARDLGGGGHATAAVATLKDSNLAEAREKLLRSLQRHVRPQPIAQELMSTPAITIPADISLKETQVLLNRYGINSVVILEPIERRHPEQPARDIIGIITRRVVEKALHHVLGDLAVGEYMSTDIEFLSKNATLADIQEVIIEHRQRLIPIIHDGNLEGVITRTDLLNHLVNAPSQLPKNRLHEAEYPSLEQRRNVANLITKYLDAATVALLKEIGAVADATRYTAFAVGGFVRDLLLKKQNFDLDIVVEGDGIVFAKALAERLDGRYRTHERFATAAVILPDGYKLDVATARIEYYECPAALPTVELSSIKLDLYRRDFTINAMAIQLNTENFGTLIDFFNCQNDLKNKEIKVLHNLSFVEDPSRIFRAIRFEQRMQFRIAAHTRRLITNAVKMDLFGKATDTRLFSEVCHILSEHDPIPAIERLAAFNLFRFLWPDLQPHLKIDRRFSKNLSQAKANIAWHREHFSQESCEPWMVYLLTIMGRSSQEVLAAFCKRFLVPRKIREFLLEQKKQADKCLGHLLDHPNIPESELYWLVEELHIEGMIYLLAIAPETEIKARIIRYLTELRYCSPILNGSDLTALGYKPGPHYKIMLNTLLARRLDGKITSRKEELTLLEEKYPLEEGTPNRK